MKTNQKNQFVFLGVFLQLALVLTGCGSNGSNNQTAAAPASYYQSNGQCYNSANQVVPYTYCNSTGINGGYQYINGMCYQGSTPVSTQLCSQGGVNGGYQMVNGQCITTSNGQPVSITYCQQSGGLPPVQPPPGGGGPTSQVCYGYYASPQWGMGVCYGSPDNCAGYVLTPVSQQGQPIGPQVYCQ